MSEIYNLCSASLKTFTYVVDVHVCGDMFEYLFYQRNVRTLEALFINFHHHISDFFRTIVADLYDSLIKYVSL